MVVCNDVNFLENLAGFGFSIPDQGSQLPQFTTGRRTKGAMEAARASLTVCEGTDGGNKLAAVSAWVCLREPPSKSPLVRQTSPNSTKRSVHPDEERIAGAATGDSVDMCDVSSADVSARQAY